MASWRSAALLSTVLALAAPGTALAGARPSVVNGRAVAVPGYMGFVVAVTEGDHANVCGGTAIRPNVLLTAAHCVVNPKRNAFVQPAQLHLLFGFDDPWGAIQGSRPIADDLVAEYVTPGNYGRRSGGAAVNDVALLRLREPAPGTIGVLPARRAALIAPGHSSVVLGWGTESESSHANSTVLLRADMTLQAAGYCARYLRSFSATTMLCAQSPRQSPCNGDSGGPLLVVDRAHRPYVAGVVSFGIACRGGLPTVFADVSRGPLARFVSREAARLQRKADAEPPDLEQPTVPIAGAPEISR
jgi:trypsin